MGYQRTVSRHGSSQVGTEEVKHPQPRTLPKPPGRQREVRSPEPGSWKRAALCSGFSSRKPDSKCDGLNPRAIPQQPARFASVGAEESFCHRLFPPVPAETGFASQAVLSPQEGTGGDTCPPPAVALLAEPLPPPLSPQVPRPSLFKMCPLGCLGSSFSPCCDKL